MRLGADGRARAAKNVFARPFDEDLVILDLGRGEYFGLDALGARLWRGLSAGQSPREIAAEIGPDYDVPPEVFLHDLTTLANELLARRLIEPAAAEP